MTYLNHDRTGANGDAFANADSRQDDNVGTDPNIILNDDGFAILGAPVTQAAAIVGRCGARVNAHVGADQDIVTDANLAHVVDETIASDGDIASDPDVVAIIAVEWSLDNDGLVAHSTALSYRGSKVGRELNAIGRLKDLLEKPCTFGGRYTNAWVGRVVEPPAGRTAPLPFQNELLLERIIRATVDHLVLFPAVVGELGVGQRQGCSALKGLWLMTLRNGLRRRAIRPGGIQY